VVVGDRVEGMLPIHLASLNGHTEVVRMLLTWTHDLHNDSVSGSGLPPLMCVTQYNYLPVIRVLVAHCANVNYTSTKNEGLTVFRYVVMNGNEETVIELLNTLTHMYPSSVKGKGKVIPLQARCGPEGGKRYSSTLP